MGIALIVVAVVAALVAVLLVVPPIVLRWVARSVEPRIAAMVPATAILRKDLKANSFGLTSWGAAQARGNGGLVLTADELLFFQAVPRREIRVPLAAITEIKTVRWHLGKSYARPLLFVGFDGPSGPDSIAWYVPDVPGWMEAVERARRPTRAIGA